jgi:hypothetical protein
MRILFDQGTPAPLRHALPGHSVATVYEQGWDQLANGDLLRVAEPAFDAFVTTDKNLPYQQNLTGRKLAILVLPTTSWPKLRAHTMKVAAAIAALRPATTSSSRFRLPLDAAPLLGSGIFSPVPLPFRHTGKQELLCSPWVGRGVPAKPPHHTRGQRRCASKRREPTGIRQTAELNFDCQQTFRWEAW